MLKKLSIIVLATVITSGTVTQVACNPNYVTDLRIVLASSGPLVSSLEAAGLLPKGIGDADIQDFTDEANAVATFSTDLSACKDKACEATAAETLFNTSEAIYQRGHFGQNAKVLIAADIARGIFESIKLYYASKVQPTKLGGKRGVREPTDKEIKAKIDKLRAAMKPVG